MLSFDFNILWASKCTYPAKHVVKENYHEYYQIVFILNGEGEIKAEELVYNAYINQMYIFKPNMKHGIKASRSKPLNTVELKFYCDDIIIGSLLYRLPPYIKDVGQLVRNAFIDIVEEIKKQDKYTEPIIKALLMQIIFSVTRIADQGNIYSTKKTLGKINCENEEKIKLDPLASAVNYMEKNYHKEIKLNDLAEMVHLSPVYFCSTFKERYGVSPIQYLQSVRHENAKNLLINTDDTITMISEKVGFQSIHYFSRVFKSNEGITPNEFRKRNQGYIIKDFQGNITDFS